MPNLAENFINLVTEPGLGQPTAEGDFTEAFLAAIRQIEAPGPSSQGVIWFPPGRYIVNTASRIVVPERVTLSFAPGALLIPVAPHLPTLEQAVIRIDGLIDAEPRQIFVTPDTEYSNELRGVSLGRIVLTGNRTLRVYPEWWGASSERFEYHEEPSAIKSKNNPGALQAYASTSRQSRINAGAVQAALDAAIVYREAMTAASSSLLPVTVYLGGSYLIGRPIFVESADLRLLHNVMIEGAPSSASMPSLDCSFGTGEPHAVFGEVTPAILSIRQAANVMLRSVSFNARRLAGKCLEIEASIAGDLVDHRFALEDCSWFDALETQVSIVGSSSQLPSVGSVLATVRGGRMAVLTRKPVIDEPSSQAFSENHVLLSFRGFPSATLHIEGTVFAGPARRAIRSVGGKVELFGCRFAIVEPDESVAPTCTDVELAQDSVPQARVATIVATACVSDSPSFLRVSSPPADFQPEFREGVEATQSVLTAVVHRYGLTRGDGYLPPAVIWEGSPTDPTAVRNVLTDAGLFLVGCVFELARSSGVSVPGNPPGVRDITNLIPLPRVFVSPNLARVYNVGTFRPDQSSQAFLMFEALTSAQFMLTRSLNINGASWGPVPVSLHSGLDALAVTESGRRLLAWADWLPFAYRRTVYVP